MYKERGLLEVTLEVNTIKRQLLLLNKTDVAKRKASKTQHVNGTENNKLGYLWRTLHVHETRWRSMVVMFASI